MERSKKSAVRFRRWAAVLILLLLVGIAGCGDGADSGKTAESSVEGTVEDIKGNSFILLVAEGEEELKSSDRISVPLVLENGDKAPELQQGDRVEVVYDGALAESYPAQIHTVYEIRVLESAESQAEYTQITNEEAKKKMEQDPEAVILDVREQDEYDQGHIPGAVLLPVGSIDADAAMAAIPSKNTTVLVYCRSGNRSKTASAALAELGYTQVYEFGGIIDWPYEIEK